MLDVTTNEEFSKKEDIFFAAECDRNDIIYSFLKKGLDVNIQDEKGDTLLHYATRRGNVSLIKHLFKHGAKIILNKKNRSPLLDAYANGETEIANDITKFVIQKNSIKNLISNQNIKKVDTNEQHKLKLFVNDLIKHLRKNYLDRNIPMRFSAKHNERARSLIIAARRCNTLNEFNELLNNQLSLFNNAPKRSLPNGLIAERWSEVIKNKPINVNKSQFYKTLNIFVIDKFSNNKVNNGNVRDVLDR